jgi:hypothetical protein
MAVARRGGAGTKATEWEDLEVDVYLAQSPCTTTRAGSRTSRDLMVYLRTSQRPMCYAVGSSACPATTSFVDCSTSKPIDSFEKLTDRPEWVQELRRVYNDDVEQLDQMIGMYAENPPQGFAFSDTAFRIFVLMASRRLNSDRFLTTDYNEHTYTKVGIEWVNDTDMSTVLLRHYPNLVPALRGVTNAFWPWTRISS